MKRVLAWLAACWILQGAVAFGADSSRHVVIISLDGCIPLLMQDEHARNLRALWQNGCYSWSAQTVNPSVTLTAHASLLTGVTPDKHGVKSNAYSSEENPLNVPTILELARKAGLETVFIASKMKLLHLDKAGSANVSLFPRTVMEELGYDPNDPSRTQPPFDVVKAVRECFGSVTPNLCVIHFAEPDHKGHAFGWRSAEYVYALRQVDQKIGALLAFWKRSGYRDTALIIVTADHGGHDNTHGTTDSRDMTIPWIAWGQKIRKNHALQTPIRIDDTAATAAFYLKLRIPPQWDGRVITEIFR